MHNIWIHYESPLLTTSGWRMFEYRLLRPCITACALRQHALSPRQLKVQPSRPLGLTHHVAATGCCCNIRCGRTELGRHAGAAAEPGKPGHGDEVHGVRWVSAGVDSVELVASRGGGSLDWIRKKQIFSQNPPFQLHKTSDKSPCCYINNCKYYDNFNLNLI